MSLEQDPSTSASTESKRPPYAKKKLALLFGYSGEGYSGLQINPGAKTIEQELLKALLHIGMIWERNGGDPKKIDWQRACRTDKGVHAAGNIVSFKGLQVCEVVDKDAEWSAEYSINELNKALPNQIRVFDIIRVTNSFDSHTQCDSRFYEYLFPTALLAPNGLPELFIEGKEQSGYDSDYEEYELTASDIELFSNFRLSADRFESLQSALKQYCGTRNFFNFTIGKLPTDPSANRFIRSFTADSPFICPQDNVEWIRVRVHGASFMLHQIRKMVSLAILAVRFGLNSEKVMAEALDPQGLKINIPKAPSVGLFLDRSIFEGYNKYIEGASGDLSKSHMKLDFGKYEQEREALKKELIYPQIFGRGVHEFGKWLKGIQEHSYEFKYLLKYI